MLPYTWPQLLDTLQSYNHGVWPLQVVLYFAALGAVAMAYYRTRLTGLGVSGLLAVLWAWTGLAFYWPYFAPINQLAGPLAVVFVLQAALFAWEGLRQRRLVYQANLSLAGLAGAGLLVYALLIHPAIGPGLGLDYPRSLTFGTTSPELMFTFGMLLWTVQPVARYLLVLPTLVLLLRLYESMALGLWHDSLGMLLALTAVGLLVLRDSVRTPRGMAGAP